MISVKQAIEIHEIVVKAFGGSIGNLQLQGRFNLLVTVGAIHEQHQLWRKNSYIHIKNLTK